LLVIQAVPHRSLLVFKCPNTNQEVVRLRIVKIKDNVFGFHVNDHGEPYYLVFNDTVRVPNFNIDIYFYKKRGSYCYLNINAPLFETTHTKESKSDRDFQPNNYHPSIH
jgi:hypothetical protein